MIGAVFGTGDREPAPEWDFFVSYTAADRPWAEWIAWQLEDGGYRVLIQAWDFVAGSNWQIRMQQGVVHAQRTVAVMSTAYLRSVYGQQEWQAAQAADPLGFARKLLPVRIEECLRPGLLGQVVSIDLFDLTVEQTRHHLLNQIGFAVAGRAKPVTAPDLPVRPRANPPVEEPTFPAPQGQEAAAVDDIAQRGVAGPHPVPGLSGTRRRRGRLKASWSRTTTWLASQIVRFVTRVDDYGYRAPRPIALTFFAWLAYTALLTAVATLFPR